MRSKTSKPAKSARLLKTAPGSSESGSRELARWLAGELELGDRVLLEGEVGAGKTTFARALLEALRIDQPAEGSPTFPIVHEYRAPIGEVIHIDLYRLKSDREIDEAGLPSYFWDRDAVVLCEWLTLFPEFRAEVLKTGRVFRVSLLISSEPDRRDIRIERIA